MPSDELAFFVAGKPQVAGSKSIVPITNGKGETVARRVVESGDRQAKKTWRGDLRDAAARAIEGRGGEWDPTVAFDVRFVFVRKRPSSHLRTGKHAGVVKDAVLGVRPVTRPDALKNARHAEDSLTGILWADDSQIVDGRQTKVFGDQIGLSPTAEGVLVVVRPAHAYAGPRWQGAASADTLATYPTERA